MNEIIGHSKILDFFTKAIKNEGLSHAYCFTGPSMVGKLTVARGIAEELLKVEKEKLNISPDFSLVEKIINEKTGKLRKDISIEQIRNLISVLLQSAFSKDGYKVAIIDDAHLMSKGASNALLKTLEEPKTKTILFLITTDENKLLPTIQSRCQMIYFSLVPTDEIEKIDGATKDMAGDAYGRPGRVFNWLEDSENYSNYKKEVDRFQNLIGKEFFQKLSEVEELFGDKTDHIMARDNLLGVLDIWQIQLHESLKTKNKNFENERLILIDKDIRTAREMLAKNVHPRLLIEHILLQLP